jgi:adenosylmethionine-8-amino-7-oxononanoate aminotransferase
MGAVELAPPVGDLRWGRRVCAGTVARGVLLRPLGDDVVLMPPLTITTPELERIVEALRASLLDVLASHRANNPPSVTPKRGEAGDA